MSNPDRPGYAERVSRSLKSMDGVLDVGINFVTDKVYVTYDPLVLARAQVRKAIEDTSGEPEAARDCEHIQHSERDKRAVGAH